MNTLDNVAYKHNKNLATTIVLFVNFIQNKKTYNT